MSRPRSGKKKKKPAAGAGGFDTLLEHSNDAIFLLCASTGEIQEINDLACTYLAMDREKLLETHFQDLVPPISWQEVNDLIKGYMPSPPEERPSVTTVLLGANELKTPVEIKVGLVECNGEGIAVIVVREIKERKRAEASLRKSERLYRLLAENLLGYIWARDADLNFTYISPSIKLVRGYTVEEAIGQKLEDICTPESLPVALKAFKIATKLKSKRSKELNKLHTFELEMTCKDGSTVWVETTMSVFRRSSGKAAGFVGVSRDVTERKRAEEEHAKLEAQVQHAQKLESLGVLAGGIAHDFNNLLTGILGYANLVLVKLPKNSPARRGLRQIEASAERAAGLTRQMLAYTGKGKFEVGPINISKLVEDTAHLLEVSVSKKAVLEYDFAEDLPAVQGDSTQMQQVVMNLITNASDAIGDEVGEITVKTGVIEADKSYLADSFVDDNLPAGNYVFLEVSDTGCGMDAETIAKVFDPFFSTKFTGRGLGLAAVLGIVRGHNGAVKIDSELGKRTTFRVLLPTCEGPSDPSGLLPPLKTDSFLEYRGKGTVLVVDDEELVRALCKDTLTDIGFNVMEAEDGLEAVVLAREHAPEIVAVILDLTMPNMDGEETFKELRRIRADVPVILSSGYDEQEAVKRFDAGELAGFIQKPYQSEELIKRLRQVLMN